MRAIGLLSGGLDSTLALRILIDQGVEVTALNFVSVFCTCTPKQSCCGVASKAAGQLGVDLKVVNASEEFVTVVKNPEHGYGSNLNPCIDCRILMMRKARSFMHEAGASFLVTGEVLGERPVSQRRDVMRLIEREAGVGGLVVRPLSAALLEPSLPELQGWVDRGRLLSIQGRSRKPQIHLARAWRISDYPCPAGGCRLTDPIFAARMRDLMTFDPAFVLNDVQLLKVGRHFRLSSCAKAVVGRNEAENGRLRALARETDVLMEVADVPGPLTILRGDAGARETGLSAALTARYSKARQLGSVTVRTARATGHEASVLRAVPLHDEGVRSMRICSPGRRRGARRSAAGQPLGRTDLVDSK